MERKSVEGRSKVEEKVEDTDGESEKELGQELIVNSWPRGGKGQKGQ